MAPDNGAKTGVFVPGLTENALFEIRSVNCAFLVGIAGRRNRGLRKSLDLDKLFAANSTDV